MMIDSFFSKLKVGFFVVASSTIASSCNEGCEDFDNFPEFDNLSEIPSTTDVDLNCIEYSAIPQYGFVTLQTDYESTFGAPMGSTLVDCNTDSLPSVDFFERSIIWFQTTRPTVNTKVVRNGDTLHYLVKVRESQFASLRFRMNCVSIPKIGFNDTIIFKANTYGCD